MFILEHDAKDLLGSRGLRVPSGALVGKGGTGSPPFEPPWIVKTQIPVGGRGKAGGVIRIESPAALAKALDDLFSTKIKGHPVRECRVEEAVLGAQEVYLGLILDSASAMVRVLVSASGGVDVEEQDPQRILTRLCEPDAASVRTGVGMLSQGLPAPVRTAVNQAADTLAQAFFDFEAMLIEINPLFVRDNEQASGRASWVAGDIRMVVDENAVGRQDELRDLLRRRAGAYPDVDFKQKEGFDFVVVDPDGDIGLVTTGAGLSMKLIDELIGQGARPINFCDIRSGQMRGDPSRLIGVFQHLAEAPNLRSILVNIFAGITDLGEFADLLVRAMKAVPGLDVPVVVRLVGNGEDRAEELLHASRLPVTMERDLDAAVRLAVGVGGGHDA